MGNKENEKAITGTMVSRWIGILTLVVVSISATILITGAVRSGESAWNAIADHWWWMFPGPVLSGSLLLRSTAKKGDKVYDKKRSNVRVVTDKTEC